MNYRIGVDVGGTNTDAVILNSALDVVATVKSTTTSDVMTGIKNAITEVLRQAKIDKSRITHAMLGTTHCTNAIIERKRLMKVGIVRIGKPASLAIPPMSGWPEDLVACVSGKIFFVGGGHEFDGREIVPFNEAEMRQACREMKNAVESVVITSIFSPLSAEHEKRALVIVKEELGEDFPYTISSDVASIGLLERENAAILNSSLFSVAYATTEGFRQALAVEGIHNAQIYFCQNDGTLMSYEFARHFPILTVACGPTNSIRGATYLARQDNGIIVDVGGTTTDIGVVIKGFPRESAFEVNFGGVDTNFRMPDIISIGIGGGSIVRCHKDNSVTVGPDSVGYQITEKAMVFGGDVMTATDVAVRLGMAQIGDSKLVMSIPEDLAKKAIRVLMEQISLSVDKMKISKDPVPLVLVGGGSIILNREIEGVSEILEPEHFGEANAIGASISKISGQADKVYYLQDGQSRETAINNAVEFARQEAIAAGASPQSVEVVDVEYLPLAYMGNAVRIKVKAVGNFV